MSHGEILIMYIEFWIFLASKLTEIQYFVNEMSELCQSTFFDIRMPCVLFLRSAVVFIPRPPEKRSNFESEIWSFMHQDYYSTSI